MSDPSVGWFGRFGSDGDGSLATPAALLLVSTLGFFHCLLLARIWPDALPDGGILVGAEAWTRPAITFPDDAEIDGRARWPAARELTAAMTCWASGPSYGRNTTTESLVGDVN